MRVGASGGKSTSDKRAQRPDYPMLIRVLFFGATADAVGTRQTEVTVNDESSIAEVVDRLSLQYPQLSNRKLLTAVNEEYRAPNVLLRDGDQLAIFTAVSGG